LSRVSGQAMPTIGANRWLSVPPARTTFSAHTSPIHPGCGSHWKSVQWSAPHDRRGSCSPCHHGGMQGVQETQRIRVTVLLTEDRPWTEGPMLGTRWLRACRSSTSYFAAWPPVSRAILALSPACSSSSSWDIQNESPPSWRNSTSIPLSPSRSAAN